MPILLTAAQIKAIDEISLDKRVNDKTLEIALRHHSNTLNAIIKLDKAWWHDIQEVYALDKTTNWTIKNCEVVKVDNGEVK